MCRTSLKNFSNSFLLFEMDSRMMINHLYFNVFIAYLTFDLHIIKKSYVCAHVKFRIIKYFFLKELSFRLLIHIFFEEMKRCISLLSFNWSSHSLLFLEDSVEIFIISVIATALNVAHDVKC